MSDFAYPLHEECGVFGILGTGTVVDAENEDVAAAAYSALYALQHRGQADRWRSDPPPTASQSPRRCDPGRAIQ